MAKVPAWAGTKALTSEKRRGFFALGAAAGIGEFAGVVSAPSFTFDVLLYGALAIGTFMVLWVYYDRRDRALYETGRRKISFHCIRCDHLYTERPGTSLAPCPRCGHQNVRLKF